VTGRASRRSDLNRPPSNELRPSSCAASSPRRCPRSSDAPPALPHRTSPRGRARAAQADLRLRREERAARRRTPGAPRQGDC